jgi:5-oxoprolinase (ATP-hydrolysing) subunit A
MHTHMNPVFVNVDCGDGLSDDESNLRHAHAANIACGALAAHAEVMRYALRLCKSLGVRAGASPSHLAREDYGRRVTVMTPDGIATVIDKQLRLLRTLAEEEGVTLTHVKLHGALHQFAATDPDVAAAVAETIYAVDPGLLLIAQSGSKLIDAARRVRLPRANDVPVDRVFEPDGTLRGPSQPGAYIDDPDACAARARQVLDMGFVSAANGVKLFMDVESISIDGGRPRAASRLRAIRRMLDLR